MKIDIAAISLDPDNFRHDKATSEREAIQALLSNEKTHKVAELAQDIVEQRGLDPSSLLIVTNDPANPERYIALEGNRRITALKTLMTPDLATGIASQSKFRALHSDFLDLKITSVECVVLDREQASTWIKRKHYKGMGGVGVVPWNAVATARSDAKEGRYSRWMTALAYLEKRGIDAEGFRDRISAKTSTVEKVLSSSYITTELGLTFGNDGTLKGENGDEAAIEKLLVAMFKEMSYEQFVETEVSNSDLQLIFIEKFSALTVKRPPGSATATTGSTQGSIPTTGSTNNGANSGSSGQKKAVAASSGATSAKARANPSRTRKVLADSGLRISNQFLNKFYLELRKLNVERNPYIAAAIIRVFLEKSSTVFLEALNIPPLNTTTGATWHDHNIKLRSKVDAVLKNIDPKGNNHLLIYAQDIANGGRDKLHTTDNLNRAIHDHNNLPAHSEIVTIWDRFHPYFVEIFDRIEKNSRP